MTTNYSAFWLRRDLRLHDNAALFHAIQSKLPVICFFIFDTDIIYQLDNKNDVRINFIHEHLMLLNEQLKKIGSILVVKYGNSLTTVNEFVKEYRIANIYTNTDYEPFAINRDEKIKNLLQKQNIAFYTYKDHVIFEKKEIAKNGGMPYTMYTPYMKKWRDSLHVNGLDDYRIELKKEHFAQLPEQEIHSLKFIGFEKSNIHIPPYNLSNKLINEYNDKRNFPALQASSLLGPHLRFGTISIRQVVKQALEGHSQFLNELIWREFFIQILFNFPYVENRSFRKKYDAINWRNNEEEFKLWCEGNTGYPIVDAGMRELKTTGNMHNRVRMIVASFLCKHLLIDWRWGELWFAKHLCDYELASNNGNWQWAAGCGCDAAPYFRIFNPYTQQKKFDPNMEYIRKWIPELDTEDYPSPIVDHKMARKRSLDRYKEALKKDEL